MKPLTAIIRVQKHCFIEYEVHFVFASLSPKFAIAIFYTQFLKLWRQEWSNGLSSVLRIEWSVFEF